MYKKLNSRNGEGGGCPRKCLDALFLLKEWINGNERNHINSIYINRIWKISHDGEGEFRVDMEAWVAFVKDLGFPIAVTFYLLHRIEGKLNQLIESIHSLPEKMK